MKNFWLIFAAALAMATVLGCDRQAQEEPVPYDRAVDGPPSIVQPSLRDYDIISDPKTVINRIRQARDAAADTGGGTKSGGDPSGTGRPASDAEVTQVKETLAKFVAAKDAGEAADVLALFDSDSTATTNKMTEALTKVQTKAVVLATLMETKFGDQLPPKVKKNVQEMTGSPEGMLTPSTMLAAIPPVDQLTMTSFGQKIVAEGPNKQKFVFSKAGDGWLIALSDDQKALLDVFTELFVASEKIVDALKAGIDDGSITAMNIEAKGDKLAEEMIGPLKDKLTAIMMKALQGAMGGAVDGGNTGGGTGLPPDDDAGGGTAPPPDDGAGGGTAPPPDDGAGGGTAPKADDDAGDAVEAPGGTTL